MLKNNFFHIGHFFSNLGMNYSNFLNNDHIFDLNYFVKIQLTLICNIVYSDNAL
jgi:hypothetical protein